MNGINNSNFFSNMSQIGGKSKMASKGAYTEQFGKSKNDKPDNIGKDRYDTADFSSIIDKKIEEQNEMKVGKTNETEKVAGISETAQNYLDKLKEKYPGMDFIIAEFSTDAEADKLLSQGKGEYNVLITPALLERMATDTETAAKYEGIIEKSVTDFSDNAEELNSYKEDVADKYGVSVDSEGNVNYYALLKDGLENEDGENRIKASTIEELLDKLNEIREKRKAEEAERAEDADKKSEDEIRAERKEHDKKPNPYEYGQYAKPPVKDVSGEAEEMVDMTV